jgi:hypothetical protein
VLSGGWPAAVRGSPTAVRGSRQPPLDRWIGSRCHASWGFERRRRKIQKETKHTKEMKGRSLMWIRQKGNTVRLWQNTCILDYQSD